MVRRWWSLVCILVLLPRFGGAIDIIKEVENKPKISPNQFMAMPRDIVDQWVFGGVTNRDAARPFLQNKLKAKTDMINDLCGLDDRQRMKLNLAGSGDIQTFMRTYEHIRRSAEPNNNNINDLWQLAEPLQRKFNTGFFGQDSLYDAVLKQCLEADQLELFREREKQSRRYALEAAIRKVVADFEQVCPMTAEKREQLTQLMIDKIPVPLIAHGPQPVSMLPYYVMYFANEIDTSELKTCMDDEQWNRFSVALRLGKGRRRTLEAQGMLKAN